MVGFDYRQISPVDKIEERHTQEPAVRGLAAKGTKLFAIREGVDELLDVARVIYQDTRRDIAQSKSFSVTQAHASGRVNLR